MRSVLVRGLLLLATAATLGGCSRAPSRSTAVDRAAIGPAIDRIVAALIAGCAARDTSAIVALYADDAQLMPPNAPPSIGREAIRQAWVGFLSVPAMELTAALTNKTIAESGDVVVGTGRYLFKWQDGSGKSRTDTGKFTHVYQRVNGEWKIIVDMFNSDLPPPGP